MILNDEKLGLYGFDLTNGEDMQFLMDKGYDLEALKLSAIRSEYKSSISVYLDTIAKDSGYDNAISFTTYASGSDHFALEAQKFITFRSAVWDYAIDKFEKFSKGEIDLPSVEHFVSTLPKFDRAI